MPSDSTEREQPLPLPELILAAVTESAAILSLREDGSVLWSAAAFTKLSEALGRRFAMASQDAFICHEFVRRMGEMLGRDEDLETEIAPQLILFACLAGSGIKIETEKEK